MRKLHGQSIINVVIATEMLEFGRTQTFAEDPTLGEVRLAGIPFDRALPIGLWLLSLRLRDGASVDASSKGFSRWIRDSTETMAR